MHFFRVTIISSLVLYSLSSLAYVIGQKDVGSSKTRVQYTIVCANGQQTTVMANSNQLNQVEKIAGDFCKNRGGLAKRDGIKSNFVIDASKPVHNFGKIQKIP
jgi:hypothetical protein